MNDDNVNYLNSFNQCSYLIADVTSLLIEFYKTGKPVIFCDCFQDNNLVESARKMISTFYLIDKGTELIKTMDYLASGKDDLKENRLSIRSQIFDVGNNIGDKITEIIISNLNSQ